LPAEETLLNTLTKCDRRASMSCLRQRAWAKPSNSSFSGPIVFHEALSFVINWNLRLLLLGFRRVVFARSVAWHPFSTSLLAHLTLTSLKLSIAGMMALDECVHSIVSDPHQSLILIGSDDTGHSQQLFAFILSLHLIKWKTSLYE
jgi:hypothetical protein